ncbi:MAG: hypothetical protein ABEI54_03355 [Candidatus Bipolaricaulia bacterium]
MLDKIKNGLSRLTGRFQEPAESAGRLEKQQWDYREKEEAVRYHLLLKAEKQQMEEEGVIRRATRLDVYDWLKHYVADTALFNESDVSFSELGNPPYLVQDPKRFFEIKGARWRGAGSENLLFPKRKSFWVGPLFRDHCGYLCYDEKSDGSVDIEGTGELLDDLIAELEWERKKAACTRAMAIRSQIEEKRKKFKEDR